MGPRPRLRTVLLLVNVLILLLPLGGIAALRLYENHLIRRTESELIVQGAMVREVFRQELRERAALPREPSASEGSPSATSEPAVAEESLEPIVARLDISRDRVRPPAEEARSDPLGAEPLAADAGRAVTAILRAGGRTTLAGIRIVDRRGVVVASSRSELGLSIAHREEVARALKGETTTLLRRRVTDEPAPPLQSLSRGQRYRVFVALPVIEREGVVGAVVLSRTPMDIAKALYLNRRPLIVGATVLLTVVVLVSVLTSFTISRPIRALIGQAEGVSRGERGAVTPLRAPGTHEIARLSEAVAGMARTLEERAEYIRTFASHVSHEFKTPLTTIRGSVELLLDDFDTMSPEQRRRFLRNLGEASAHLERLVRRLLEKARADVVRPGDERTEVADALDASAQRHREAGLAVTVDQGRGVGRVRMAREILEEILSNLLENARQHGGEGVSVRVGSRLDREAAPPVVELRISDDGPGISEANASRIFTPFFTTARESGGSGLGLSIVRSLVEAHGGSIELIRTSPGAVFAIRIPRARG